MESVSLAVEENMSIGSHQRFAIMQKLASRDQPTAAVPAAVSAPVSTLLQAPAPPVVPPPPQPTRCVLLSNMVGPDEVDADLEDEVVDECGKYGNVEKVVIYKEGDKTSESEEVKIFVIFKTLAEAEKAYQSLNKRWFGGRQIRAKFHDESAFK
eukprot:TRINITY_DN2168_c0_g3_i1.p1 TRINITY_DN2168_c0_g3~~TRINITY_DN2168_c0_g3_i1.p1  ORF type:complete len:168 (-),score=51.60 TRINITY_DN2168_c0_g3_i1:384-845(-)